MKKTAHSIFGALMLCALLFASCADTPAGSGTQTSTADGTDSLETGVVTVDPYPTIREKLNEGIDYGGTPFNVLQYEAETWELYIAPEGETGETLNDAAFRRNTEVEELLNIDIVAITDADYTGKFRKAVLAGDGSTYDLICFWAPGDYSGLISDGLTYDWHDVPFIDLSADYYNHTANDAYSIDGRQFFAVSDFTYTVHQHFRILYNKELFANLALDGSPYDDVLNGTWTYPKMLEYTKGVYKDLDGDGKAGLGDQYGIVLNNAFASMFPMAAGEIPVVCGENGFEFNLLSDRIVSIVTDVVDLATNNPDAYMNRLGNNDQYQIFEAGNALFEPYASDPILCRDLTFDFGYLPYPKYDEAQENYVINAAGGLMAIPSSALDIERTGIIIEALSAASHRFITDAFVEQYIENKVLRDEPSQQIYRLMRSLETYELSYNIDPSKKLASYAYYSYFMQKKDTNIASRYEKVIDSIETKYAELYELITELD